MRHNNSASSASSADSFFALSAETRVIPELESPNGQIDITNSIQDIAAFIMLADIQAFGF